MLERKGLASLTAGSVPSQCSELFTGQKLKRLACTVKLSARAARQRANPKGPPAGASFGRVVFAASIPSLLWDGRLVSHGRLHCRRPKGDDLGRLLPPSGSCAGSCNDFLVFTLACIIIAAAL
mmetsp:Transcript_36961/g.86023  ORF Transcript_36961/g.86023 Transcript_36961/m.86023 type:complete len:123 (+) Transcript_36961:931-1299(+)